MLCSAPNAVKRLAVTFLLCCLLRAYAIGCPYLIRDVGFSAWNRGVYRLYLFLKDDSPESRRVAELFKTLSAEALADSNVEAEVIPADRLKTHEASKHLQSLPVGTLPAAILVSPDERAILLPGVGRGAVTEDGMRAEIEKIVSSPAIEDLKAHCITNWCIAILVPGQNQQENTRAKAEIEKAGAEIVGSDADMGRTIETGPHLIVVSARDPAEKILLWSLGLDQEAPRPRAVVLYARGVQIGPIFEGDEIAKESLTQTFRILGMNCSCATDPALLAGPSAPLAWGEALQAQVRETLGLDPDSPRFRSAVADYVPGAGKPNASRGAMGYSEGYVEFADKSADAPTEAAATIAAKPATKDVGKTSRLEKRTAHTMIVVVIGMVLLAAIGGGVLVVRKMRAS